MRILVIRFSALGDIALSVPVLQRVKEQFPDAEITMVSRSFAESLFNPLNVNFHPVNLNNYKGVLGLYRLFKELKAQYKPAKVIDLHGVLRTKIIGLFFKSSGVPVFQIDKGRKEKKEFTRKEKKVRKKLLHTTLRYSKVFEKAGFSTNFTPKDSVNLDYEGNILKTDLSHKVIGIAPLAFHKAKMWPISKMKELIKELIQQDVKIILFGGANESEELDKLVIDKNKVNNIAGKHSLEEEINLMQQLDVVLAMDSSNMHLATLAGVPVISIWGATHSDVGFGPLGGNEHLKVEIDPKSLDCRPCSVFGNKECFRGDYACLNRIDTGMVIQKIKAVIA